MGVQDSRIAWDGEREALRRAHAATLNYLSVEAVDVLAATPSRYDMPVTVKEDIDDPGELVSHFHLERLLTEVQTLWNMPKQVAWTRGRPIGCC